MRRTRDIEILPGIRSFCPSLWDAQPAGKPGLPWKRGCGNGTISESAIGKTDFDAKGRTGMESSGAIRKISFVVPVFNEEENIPLLVREIGATAAGLGHPYEILLVDDGSRDGTLSAIKELAAGDPALRYISFSGNRGQSAALYAGFLYAS